MKSFLANCWKHKAYVVMALPVFVILLLFAYVPMFGLVMAFKKLDYAQGIWNSPFYGFGDLKGESIFHNFSFLWKSKDTLFNMLRNTLMYYFIFTILGTFLNIVVAIAFDQFVLKKTAKVMQSIVIIPVFISYAAVQFIVYAFLGSNTGLINHMLGTNIKFYSNGALWPWILLIVKIWKDTGYGSVLYMSVLAGIDSELYEAAEIDGANKWRMIWHITLPSLIPMVTVMLLLSVGNVMRSDTGLFYQVTRNSGVLFPTTQVIDSYVLNAIFKNSNFGFTAATSFFQSIVGLLLMLFANWLVKKIEPENALF